MISQRHYVDTDSLHKSLHRKIYGTKIGQTTLGFFIHDQYILQNPIPCHIPETFVKKLAIGEEFKFILSTHSDKGEEVQNDFSKRLLIVPASITESIFEQKMSELGFLYEPSQVSVLWEDLSSRFQDEKNNCDTNMIVAQEHLPDDIIVYALDCDSMPVFPGGDYEFARYITKNYHYPMDVAQQGIIGKVIGEFVIEKDGSISNITVTQSPHEKISAEYIHLIQSMPKWKPAYFRGKTTRCKFVFLLNAPRLR